MTLELDEDKAEHLLDLQDEFRDDCVQALIDIEEGLHAHEIEVKEITDLDGAIDGFKDFIYAE